jgi:signal transduction histidine kinase
MLIVILDNAIKFSPENKTVGITLSKTESGTAVVIKDEGCGISPDDLPYIFERFYKRRSEENKTGTGLGLAIAKQIAERHIVTVEVKSTPEEGSEFTFTFR